MLEQQRSEMAAAAQINHLHGIINQMNQQLLFSGEYYAKYQNNNYSSPAADLSSGGKLEYNTKDPRQSRLIMGERSLTPGSDISVITCSVAVSTDDFPLHIASVEKLEAVQVRLIFAVKLSS